VNSTIANYTLTDPAILNAISGANTGVAANKLLKFGDCFQWCKQEHFIHNYEGMGLIGLSLISFGVYWATKAMLDHGVSAENYKVVSTLNDLSLHFAFWLIVGFAVYWRWFQVK
jgi:hypothetical protein